LLHAHVAARRPTHTHHTHTCRSPLQHVAARSSAALFSPWTPARGSLTRQGTAASLTRQGTAATQETRRRPFPRHRPARRRPAAHGPLCRHCSRRPEPRRNQPPSACAPLLWSWRTRTPHNLQRCFCETPRGMWRKDWTGCHRPRAPNPLPAARH